MVMLLKYANMKSYLLRETVMPEELTVGGASATFRANLQDYWK